MENFETFIKKTLKEDWPYLKSIYIKKGAYVLINSLDDKIEIWKNVINLYKNYNYLKNIQLRISHNYVDDIRIIAYVNGTDKLTNENRSITLIMDCGKKNLCFKLAVI